MQVITARNADVTVSGYTLVANVSYDIDNTPQELDLPSGAFYVWPLRQGTLTLQYTLDPGTAPSSVASGEVSPTPTSISFTSKTPEGGVVTIATDSAYLTGLRISTSRINEMPVLQEVKRFTVLVDDAIDSDY